MKNTQALIDFLKRLSTETRIFLSGFAFLILLELFFRRLAFQGMYFQQWTSEDMMQTLPLLALRDEPFRSFIYLHIQPPALDIFRVFLVQLFRFLPEARLLAAVDQGLYLSWAILYGLMGALLYHWLKQLVPHKFALLAAILFLFHPATILYASLLDNSFLFSLLVLWSYYELWKLYKNPRRKSIVPLALSVLLLFFTRSIYQWPVLIVYVASLFLMRVPGRKVVTFLVITGTIIAFYTTKQLYLFDFPYTSSLVAHNCLHGLGDFSDYRGYGVANIPLDPPISDALAINIRTKLSGVHNWNHYDDLQYHRALMPQCGQRLLSQPAAATIQAYIGNLIIYLQPSANYTMPHVIADRLPWRGLYNWIFSGAILLLLLLQAAIIWVMRNWRQNLIQGIGLMLPAAFILAGTVMFERGENMRYKFFIEPVLYIFILTQFYALWQIILDEIEHRKTQKQNPCTIGKES